MAETIVNYILDLFSGFGDIKFGKEILVFIISMMPILELRGGLIAASLLGLKASTSFIICLIGNIIPVPFILWLITPVFSWLKRRDAFKGFVEKIENKAMSKKERIEKLQYIGLLLFVGIPLPGTGAWTGCLIAALLDMNKKKAFVATLLGVLMAGVIMLLLSYGVLDNLIH